jgi:hypothetical protein
MATCHVSSILRHLLAVVAGGILSACAPTQYDVTEHQVRSDLPANDQLAILKTDTLGATLPAFDSSMGYFDRGDGCFINKSAAVLRLHAPGFDSAQESGMATLYPSVGQAVAGTAGTGYVSGAVLPSINVIEAKMKQFNDGLYAALDLSYYQGISGVFESHVSLMRAIFEKLTNDTAKAFVGGGLSLSDSAASGYDVALAAAFLADFKANEVRYKPIGFYTWNKALEKLFTFMRYFQAPLNKSAVFADIVRVLQNDPALLAAARAADRFYAKLTNPLSSVSVAELAESNLPATMQSILQLAGSLKRPHNDAVAFFPASTSVETELFNAMYPSGLPPDANLMNDLITAIQNGTVDLTPKAETGWYGRQVWALETFLLPSKGEEHAKLLLTEQYKKRLVEAFKAIITTQRETHVRQLEAPGALSSGPSYYIPLLRVEPGCTYFLRSSLAYAFLKEFLSSSVGQATLSSLHGLTETGWRPDDIWTELETMRSLCHGLYLVSAEDIGLKASQSPASWPAVSDKAAAEQWLSSWTTDPDLSVDTRVSVPTYDNLTSTRMWGTIGVRLCHLWVNYAVPPRVRPDTGGAWIQLNPGKCDTAKYEIPVMEFAEFTLRGERTLTRSEFRAVCDQYGTKDAIVNALERQ